MRFKFHHTSNFTKILIIAEFFLLSYLLYTLTLSIYKNYQIDLHIQAFELENRSLEEENTQIASDIEYFTSRAYSEKIAKQNFGLVNPGEEVIVVPKDSVFSDESQTGVVSGFGEEGYVSNPEIWWVYLFGRG